MVCIQCSGYTIVVNSRPQRQSNQVWRRRQCKACGALFTTEEVIDYAAAWSVQQIGGKRLEPFSRDKLFLSLYDSVGHRPAAISDATALTSSVINRLRPHMSKGAVARSVIAQVALVVLNRFDKVASVHYAARHKY